MRERKPIDHLLTVEFSKSAESRGDAMAALAALLVDVHEKTKTDDSPKEKANNKE